MAITVERDGIAYIVADEDKAKWLGEGYTAQPNALPKKRSKKATAEKVEETEEKEG